MKVSLAPKDLWWELAITDPSCTYYQTPDWYEIWEKYAKYQSKAYFFEFSDGSSAVFPMAIERKWFSWRIWNHASPASTYNEIIVKKILTEENKKLILNWLSIQNHLIFRQNPYKTSPLIPSDNFSDFTQIIDLEPSMDSILQKWSKNHQRSLKKSISNDLVCEVATSESDWNTYYEAYMDSLLRWGKASTRQYPIALFKAISESKFAKLWLASKHGNVLYGAICFYFNRRVFYWHGAGFTRHLLLRPSHFMFYQIIQDAKSSGYTTLDLNPSGGQQGVVQFKQEMGAVIVPSPVLVLR